jgi:hypothetical protein
MSTLLSFHAIAIMRGDGLLPELAALLERPIPRLTEPVDVLPDSEAPLQRSDMNRSAGRLYHR